MNFQALYICISTMSFPERYIICKQHSYYDNSKILIRILLVLQATPPVISGGHAKLRLRRN